jgi:hypothetical protein
MPPVTLLAPHLLGKIAFALAYPAFWIPSSKKATLVGFVRRSFYERVPA